MSIYDYEILDNLAITIVKLTELVLKILGYDFTCKLRQVDAVIYETKE